MKKLISICLLFFFTVKGNGQMKSNNNYNEFNQDSLNLALKETIMHLKTAKIFTLVGTGIGIAGAILLIEDSGNTSADTPSLGSSLASIGMVTVALALPRWVRHSKRKKEIELDLMNFTPHGSAAINGIGIKIRF